MDIQQRLYNFFAKRITVLFILFLLANIAANLPSLNYCTEIFSHFKLQYFYAGFIFILAFICLSFRNKRFLAGIIVSIIVISVNFIDLSPYLIRQPVSKYKGASFKLSLYNVLTSNTHYNLLLDEIERTNPDIIILQEVNDTWLDKISGLKQKYPFSVENSRFDNFGIALYSKIPFSKFDIQEWNGVPVINVILNQDNKDILLYAVHTLPPLKRTTFEIRNDMLEKINAIIEKNSGKNIVIAGDFNTTAFSPYYKKYIKSTGVNDAQSLTGNIHKGSWNAYSPAFMRITVEHILTSQSLVPVQYVQGKFFGSDHFGITVRILYK